MRRLVPRAPQIVEEVFNIVKDLNTKEKVTFLLAEQNTNMALKYADYGYIMESGRVVMDGAASDLASNEDVKEFYLGVGGGERHDRSRPQRGERARAEDDPVRRDLGSDPARRAEMREAVVRRQPVQGSAASPNSGWPATSVSRIWLQSKKAKRYFKHSRRESQNSSNK